MSQANVWGKTAVKPQFDENAEYDYEVPPAGSLAGRICAFLDVGNHDASSIDGTVYQRRTLIVGYELAKRKKSGIPFFLARSYTLSLALNSSLYKMVKAISGEKPVGAPLDPSWLANKPCLISITHTEKTKNQKTRTYANIDSVSALPEEMKSPIGSCVIWSVEERKSVPLPDVSYLPALYHEGLQKMLTVSEWVNASAEVATGGDPVPVQARPKPEIKSDGKTESARPAKAVTQQEADDDDSDIPF